MRDWHRRFFQPAMRAHDLGVAHQQGLYQGDAETAADATDQATDGRARARTEATE